MSYYRHATPKHSRIKFDLISCKSCRASTANEQDREKLAEIKGKGLEIINEAIDAMNRLRSSKPPN
jgi:hypothetical protein